MTYLDESYSYDWEVYRNFLCVVFIPNSTPKQYLDAYIKIDIEYLRVRNNLKKILGTNDYDSEIDLTNRLKSLIAAKNEVLKLMEVKQFTVFYDTENPKNSICELGLILEFFIEHKIIFGYNSFNYDSFITDYILIHGKKFNPITGKNSNNIHICQELYRISTHLVSTKREYIDLSWKPKYYKRLFTDYDIQKILYLDKSFIGLKSVAINLKWHRIQELPIPFDSIIKKTDVYNLLDYNVNDGLITNRLVTSQRKEINLRDKLSIRYDIDLRNDSRSSIGKRLMILYYMSRSGLTYKELINLRTHRGRMSLSSIITDKVYFRTNKFKNFLTKLKSEIITPGDEFTRIFEHNGTYYTIAKGGIHSIDDSRFYVADSNTIIRDADITSYYPSILLIFGISPKHLDLSIFLELVALFKDDRVKAKDAASQLKKIIKTLDASDSDMREKIEKLHKYIEDFTIEAEGLKIVINRIYGALSDINDPLFDPKATYMTTFNGQLTILMLIERLEEASIHCISANTDGIVCKFDNSQESTYYAICNEWEADTEFRLEYTDYEKYVRVNVNNYIAVKKGFINKYNEYAENNVITKELVDELEEQYVKSKGLFTTEIGFSKGFIHPIVSLALKQYILYDIPYKQTIEEHIHTSEYAIYDYCISQKVDKKFNVQYIRVEDGIVLRDSVQQYNRYYICTKGGGSLIKCDVYRNKPREQQLMAKKRISIFNDYYSADDYFIDFSFYIHKVEEWLYFKKKNPKGNHKYEGILIRGNNLFSNLEEEIEIQQQPELIDENVSNIDTIVEELFDPYTDMFAINDNGDIPF